MTSKVFSAAEWDFVQQCIALARRQDEQRGAWKEYKQNLCADSAGDVQLALPKEPAADFGSDPGDYWIAMEKRSNRLFLLCCERGPQFVRARGKSFPGSESRRERGGE